MKVALASDVHLEFGPLELKNTEGADVLILSGDICVAADIFLSNDPYGIVQAGKGVRYKEFFANCAAEFPYVVYVMGNHEHYHGDFANTYKTLKEFLSDLPNVHLLDKEFVEIGDHIFYGGTLWTDFDQGHGPGDQSAMRSIQGMMNDYRGVKNSAKVSHRRVPVYKKDENGEYIYETVNGIKSVIEVGMKFVEQTAKFSPEDSFDEHNAFIKGLEEAMSSRPEMKFVVVGHHAPSKQSTHPRYKDETLMNTAYSSDLTGFILEHSQIRLWTHGHTHETFDYMCGNTRITCNPRGYHSYEQRADDFELLFLEI